MTLALVKTYTPVTGDFTVVSGYNTDVATLFNAFSGIEAQTSIPKGLTITPTSNAIKTFNITDVNTASIFSVDTTNGLPMFKTSSVMIQNTFKDYVPSDVTCNVGQATGVGSGGSYQCIDTLKPSTNILINTHANFVITLTCSYCDVVIKRYFGVDYDGVGGSLAETKSLGRFYSANSFITVSAISIFTALPVGRHRFVLVVTAGGATGAAKMRAITQPTTEPYNFSGIEI